MDFKSIFSAIKLSLFPEGKNVITLYINIYLEIY
jgi:hypothetical protein